MLRRFVAMAIVALAAVVFVVRADDFWEKKPWTEWSKGDTEKLLHDSPWAKKWKLEMNNTAGHLPSVTGSVGSVASAGGAGAGAAQDTMGGESNSITYYIQLRSSMPVREAVVRQKQIQQKYDKMNEADKKKFDSQMEQTLKGSEDAIEVHLTFETGNQRFAQALTKYWGSLPEGAVPEGVYLVVDGGSPVAPLTYAPPPPKGATTEFDLTFPRMMNNQPVIGASAKSIKLMFPHPAIGEYPAQTATVEYKMDRMLWEGKPSF